VHGVQQTFPVKVFGELPMLLDCEISPGLGRDVRQPRLAGLLTLRVRAEASVDDNDDFNEEDFDDDFDDDFENELDEDLKEFEEELEKESLEQEAEGRDGDVDEPFDDEEEF
jgi:hypothetical protein